MSRRDRADSRQARSRREALLALFAGFARLGEPLPRWVPLAEAIGCTRAMLSHAMSRLAGDGKIHIERAGRARRVTIVATGETTGWSSRAPGLRPVRLAATATAQPAEPVAAPARTIPDWQPKTCQWLDGDARERNFCAAAVRAGSSYCDAHHVRTHFRRPAMLAAGGAA